MHKHYIHVYESVSLCCGFVNVMVNVLCVRPSARLCVVPASFFECHFVVTLYQALYTRHNSILQAKSCSIFYLCRFFLICVVEILRFISFFIWFHPKIIQSKICRVCAGTLTTMEWTWFHSLVVTLCMENVQVDTSQDGFQ